MTIFKEILDLRSYTVILYRIEDALPNATGAEKEALTRMQNTNKLDEIYAIAHEQLGHHEEAARLRKWLAEQELKRKAKPELPEY